MLPSTSALAEPAGPPAPPLPPIATEILTPPDAAPDIELPPAPPPPPTLVTVMPGE